MLKADDALLKGIFVDIDRADCKHQTQPSQTFLSSFVHEYHKDIY